MTWRLLVFILAAASSGLAATRNLTRHIDYRFITAKSRYIDYRGVFSPGSGTLVFEHTRIGKGSRTQLWLVSRKGRHLRALIPASFPYASTRPTWSARNNLIAFAGEGSSGATLWIVNPNGTGLTQITGPDFTPYISYPHWFPSGDSLAVVNYNGNLASAAGVIQRIILDSNNPANAKVEDLTDPSVILAGEPAVSPNGRHIAMAAQRYVPGRKYDQQNNQIWILDVQTRALRVFDAAEGRAPSWSPDGRWITFESNRASRSGAEYAIYAKRFPRGSRLYQLTPSIFNAQHCAWSPNGRYLTCSAQLDTLEFNPKKQVDSGARGLLLIQTPKQLRQRRIRR